MTTERNDRAVQAVAAVRGAWGATLLVAPHRALRLAGAGAPGRLDTAVVRVLGARQLGQSAVTLTRPQPPVPLLGVVTDALHGLSMVALAALDRPRRRLALTDAAVASAWAVSGAWADWRVSRRSRSTPRP